MQNGHALDKTILAVYAQSSIWSMRYEDVGWLKSDSSVMRTLIALNPFL